MSDTLSNIIAFIVWLLPSLFGVGGLFLQMFDAKKAYLCFIITAFLSEVVVTWWALTSPHGIILVSAVWLLATLITIVFTVWICHYASKKQKENELAKEQFVLDPKTNQSQQLENNNQTAIPIDYNQPERIQREQSLLGRLDKDVGEMMGKIFNPKTDEQDDNSQTNEISTQLPPNIVCLGEGDIDVELDRREVFRVSNNYDCLFRAMTAEFYNKPTPPQKIGSIDNVQAEIIYYDLLFRDMPSEIYRTSFACWLNEECPNVQFDVNQKHHLILGVMRANEDGDGYKRGFRIYENNSDISKPISHFDFISEGVFKIVVNIVAGEYGELGNTYEFELDIDVGAFSFTFHQITEQVKKERFESCLTMLESYAKKGSKLLKETTAIDTKFSKEYYDWRRDVEGHIRKNIGVKPASKFSSLGNNLKTYHLPPQDFSDGQKRRLNELYTQLMSLESIIRELKYG